MPLGPAQVHPLQHLGEVGRVDPAGLGADGDEGVALVVLPGEERADLEGVDRLAQRGQLVLGLDHAGVVALLLPELDEHREVVEARAQAAEPVDVGLQPREPGGDLLGVVDVVPQVGRGDLLLELGDLAALAGGVEHRLDGGERPLEVGDLHGEVGTSHDMRV